MKNTNSVLLITLLAVCACNTIQKTKTPADNTITDRKVAVDTSLQNQKYELLDPTELNTILKLTKEKLTAKEVMELYYPLEIDNTKEGAIYISLVEPTTNNDYTVITLIDYMPDDSVRGEKYVMSLTQKDHKWSVLSLKRNWTCHLGRGHQNWGITYCK